MYSGKPSRLSSWFACDKPEFATKYLESEIAFKGRDGQRHLYAIVMETCSKHPMFLVHVIARKLSEGDENTALKVADEYWTPTQEWKFWEYINPEMVVIGPEACPSSA